MSLQKEGPVATEVQLVAPTVPPASSALPPPPPPPPPPPNSLKRPREHTPPPPLSPASTSPTADEFSPSKIARLVGFNRDSPAPAPPALESDRRARDDEQRLVFAATSDNPSQRGLSALMAGEPAISRPRDAPPVVSTVENDAGPGTGTDTAAVALAAAVPPGFSSPAPMDLDARAEQRLYAQQQPDAQMEDKEASGSSLSYPGILPPGVPMQSPGPPPRGMTLPVGTSDGAAMGPRSPTSKKHKCPYCDTEFTRHHNLKSHLLTHSQEKPYVCQTCNLRFRRLHDLKRHSKLHTGEKPHVCPKCDRKFARGDALARHSKGAGGCAGRRTSMGSFAGEEDFEAASMTEADDSVMGGMIYGDANADPDLTEDDRRRLSLPSIKAQHVTTPPDSYTTHSSTYPPAGSRPAGGAGLCPPAGDRPVPGPNPSAASGQAQPPSISALPTSAPTPSLYSQSGIAESPKPLSPATEGQQRTVHAQNRAAEPPASAGLPAPTHGTSAAQQAWLKRYPPADGLLQANNGPGPRARNTGDPGPVDNANNLFASGEQGMWAYLQELDGKVKQLTAEAQAGHDKVKQLTSEVEVSKRVEAQLHERIAALTSEVATLRQQLAAPPSSA